MDEVGGVGGWIGGVWGGGGIRREVGSVGRQMGGHVATTEKYYLIVTVARYNNLSKKSGTMYYCRGSNRIYQMTSRK